MIDDVSPSCGITNSPRPQRGPEPNSRISLAILSSETAIVLRAPETSASASCGDILAYARLGREYDPAQSSSLRAKCFVESRRRIQAGTDRCTALRQNGQPRQRGLDARHAVADLAGKRIKG